MNANVSHPLIDSVPLDHDLLAALPGYCACLPPSVTFESDVWNLAALSRETKIRAFNIYFSKIGNEDLRVLSKIRIAELIAQRQIAGGYAQLICSAFVFLAEALQARSFKTLTTYDVRRAEEIAKLNRGSPVRTLGALSNLCGWLNLHFGLRLDYRPAKLRATAHGKLGTESGRHEKLIPDQVLAEILSHQVKPETSTRDRFFISALAIAIGTGLRISELMTLPVDCLVADDRALLIRHFTGKGGRESGKPIVPDLRGVIEEAVAFIQSQTEAARDLARKRQGAAAPLDWVRILSSNDPAAISYFVRRWAKRFVESPDNRLIDPRMAWSSSKSKWLPVEDAFDRHNGNASAMALELGVDRITIPRLLAQTAASRRGEIYLGKKSSYSLRSYDTDKRIVSCVRFAEEKGLRGRQVDQVYSIIAEAAWSQIKQIEF